MGPPPIVLYQHGDNMFSHKWKDSEDRLAFSVSEANRDPNLVVKVHRENAWSSLHPAILGPEKSWFFLGPRDSPGYVCYGNNQKNIGMGTLRHKKRENSNSRYFTTQAGKEYKWKLTPTTGKWELIESPFSTLAIYELSHPEADDYGKLTIKAGAVPWCTEVVTTLVLNRMAADLQWE